MASRREAAVRVPAAWWSTYFDAGYLREYAPLFDPGEARAQVARLLEVLAVPSGARVLDLACGQGRHAALLAEAGHAVTGLDLSRPLLAVARTAARATGLPTRASALGRGRALGYRHGDMRRLPTEWRGRFDAVVNLFTSFGFFDDPADDARVIREVARVLRLRDCLGAIVVDFPREGEAGRRATARALEDALGGIAERYGARTAAIVAKQLEYPR